MANKKSWLAIVALIIATLITVACSAGQEVDSGQEDDAEVVELTAWDIPASEAYTAYWTDYTERFNNSHTDVQVSYEVFEIEAMRAKTLSALATDTAPCILYSQPYPEIREAAREGKLLALDEYIDPNVLEPLPREIMTVDGSLYGVPRMISTTYIYYNKDLFAQAGIDPEDWADPNQPTWDEFVAASEALQDGDITPIMLGGATLWAPQMWYWSFHHRYGGYEGLENAVTGEDGASFEDEAFIKAGEMVQDLVARGFFIEGFNGIGEDTMYSDWANGEAAMIYMGQWIIGSLADAPEGFEFGWFDFPSLPDGNEPTQHTTQGGVEGFWVPATCEHPEAVAEFFNWEYLTPEGAAEYSEESGNLSPVVGVLPDEIDSDDAMSYQVVGRFRDTSDGLFSWYDHSIPAEVNEVWFSQIQALYSGDLSPQEFSELSEQAAETAR